MVLPVYKGKGDPMECGSYRGITLLQQIEIDDMQFGFMKGKGTTDAIFMARQIRYDTRCYFNVRSKANMSQLNLPHGNDN